MASGASKKNYMRVTLKNVSRYFSDWVHNFLFANSKAQFTIPQMKTKELQFLEMSERWFWN